MGIAMLTRILTFRDDENGAVAVDWVVLTASIVALNIIAVINFLEGGLADVSTDVSDRVATAAEQE